MQRLLGSKTIRILIAQENAAILANGVMHKQK